MILLDELDEVVATLVKADTNVKIHTKLTITTFYC